MRSFLFALLIVVSPAAQAGEVYDMLRARLIADGWVPAANRGPTDYGSPFYPEAQNCAGTGIAPCLMIWRKGEDIKRVYTVGEPPSTVERVQ